MFSSRYPFSPQGLGIAEPGPSLPIPFLPSLLPLLWPPSSPLLLLNLYSSSTPFIPVSSPSHLLDILPFFSFFFSFSTSAPLSSLYSLLLLLFSSRYPFSPQGLGIAETGPSLPIPVWPPSSPFLLLNLYSFSTLFIPLSSPSSPLDIFPFFFPTSAPLQLSLFPALLDLLPLTLLVLVFFSSPTERSLSPPPPYFNRSLP